MTPAVWAVNPNDPDPRAIEEAARIVRQGGLVIFPTETVYGLAADATNPEAIERLNRVKGRPPEKPYSLHLADVEQVGALAPDIPPIAQRLIERFWPGPLTIVLSTPTGTVGFRVPDHPVAQAFLRRCARPIAAPSANPSGAPAPTDAREATAALDGQYDGVLDAGPAPVGRESTVVSVVAGTLTVLREGAIAAAAIQAAVGAPAKA